MRRIRGNSVGDDDGRGSEKVRTSEACFLGSDVLGELGEAQAIILGICKNLNCPKNLNFLDSYKYYYSSPSGTRNRNTTLAL